MRQKEKIHADIKLEAEKAWASWNSTVRLLAPQAHDLLYHTKEVWHEDKKFCIDARQRTLTGDWSVAEFVCEMECIQKKHAPVWCNLLKAQSDLREKIEEPYELVKLANLHLKEALEEDPLAKKYMNPLSHALFGKAWHSDQLDLHHYYSSKWTHQFQIVQMEYESIAGHPSGTLSLVKSMGQHYISERAEIIEQVHKKMSLRKSVLPAMPIET